MRGSHRPPFRPVSGDTQIGFSPVKSLAPVTSALIDRDKQNSNSHRQNWRTYWDSAAYTGPSPPYNFGVYTFGSSDPPGSYGIAFDSRFADALFSEVFTKDA